MFCCKIKNTIQSTTRNYELLDEIGMGSYGKVKLAKDVKSKKKYAIKLVMKFENIFRLRNRKWKSFMQKITF